jgi:hypothetical protein
MVQGLLSRKNPWRWLAWALPAGTLLYAALLRQSDVLSWPALAHELGPADTDIWLRLAQVRQWLGGGDFFSHSVPNTNAPNGGISIHWTRPMDALLALFYSFMPSGLGMEKRLLLASTWLPPALGVAAFAVLVRAVRRGFDNVHALWTLVLLLAVSPLSSYFPPGESDHHGLLALLWCGVVCLLMRPLTLKTGWLAGALLGAMIWISTEGLMMYAAVCAILGVAALRSPVESGPLARVTLGAALAVAAGLAVEVPPAQYFSFFAYDTISIVYVTLLALIAAGALLLSMPGIRRLSLGQRIAVAALTAAAIIAAEASLFPKALLGPLADADPFITAVFFPRVMEAKPLFAHPGVVVLQHLWQPALAAALLLAVWRLRLREERRRRLAILAGLLLVTCGVSLVQGRWTYYLQPPALIAIAIILPVLAISARGKISRWLRRIERRQRPYAALLAFVLMMLLIAAPFDVPGERDAWNCQAQIRYIVHTQQLQKLLGNKPRILYAPPEVAGDVLFFTPYRIVAGGYHREGKGLRDMEDIKNAREPKEARKRLAARKVDNLLVCPSSAPGDSWLHSLSADHHPAWLKPVPGLKLMRLQGPVPGLFAVK